MATIIQLTEANGGYPVYVVAEQVVYYEPARQTGCDVHLSSGAMVRARESVDDVRAMLTGGGHPAVEVKTDESADLDAGKRTRK